MRRFIVEVLVGLVIGFACGFVLARIF